jgi:hypothetical protein
VCATVARRGRAQPSLASSVFSARIGPSPSASQRGRTLRKAAAASRWLASMVWVRPFTQPFTDTGWMPQAWASSRCVTFGGPASASEIRSASEVFMPPKPRRQKFGMPIDQYIWHA